MEWSESSGIKLPIWFSAESELDMAGVLDEAQQQSKGRVVNLLGNSRQGEPINRAAELNVKRWETGALRWLLQMTG